MATKNELKNLKNYSKIKEKANFRGSLQDSSSLVYIGWCRNFIRPKKGDGYEKIVKMFTESKIIKWYQIKDDYYISSDRKWAIAFDHELDKDGSSWTICYSACANSDWVGIEVVPSLFEAKAAVLRLIDSGKYEDDFSG